MEISLTHLLFFCAGIMLSAMVTILALQQRNNKKLASLTGDILLLQQRLNTGEEVVIDFKKTISKQKEDVFILESEKNKAAQQCAVLKQEISELGQYKTEVHESREKIITLSKSCSELAEKLKQLDDLKKQHQTEKDLLATVREKHRKQTGEIAELKEKVQQYYKLEIDHKEVQQQLRLLQDADSKRAAELAKTATLLQKERDSSAEKITLLQEAKEEMAHRFKTVAQEIFEDKGAKFNQKQEKDLGNILNPLQQQLTSFNKRINDIHESSSKDQASLRQELETLRRSNFDLNQEAKNLSKALKGDQKIQGNWGEMILEKVLEHSGLRKGIEYETQTGHRDENQKLFKPDVIIHLPENRNLIIDSKVSLVAYEKSCAAEDEQSKATALQAHVLSVRKHIKELSDKDYGNLPDLKSPDFVLLFMPIEPAFMSAFQADEGLFQYGFERRIIVVTPTTLLATLRTIQNIWQFERQNQNTQEIADRASKIYEKIRLYLNSMDDLGKQLGKAQSTYDTAMKRLSQGRGNIVNQATELVKLGVKVKKEFPQQILDTSSMEPLDSSPSK